MQALSGAFCVLLSGAAIAGQDVADQQADKNDDATNDQNGRHVVLLHVAIQPDPAERRDDADDQERIPQA